MPKRGRSKYDIRTHRQLEKPPPIRRATKRWTHEKLLDAVRQCLYKHAEEHGVHKYIIPVYREKVAAILRAKEGMVDRCFADLNREGLLSQRINAAPYSRRELNSWQRSKYYLQKEKFGE